MSNAWGDRDELLELLARYTDTPDLPDWIDLPYRVLAERVEWDFSSLGIPPAVVERDVLIDQLRKGFAGWEATHHIATGHQVSVDGDQATIHAKIRAEHWLPADTAGDGPNCWLVVGFYDHEAIRTPHGWRLTKVKLTVTHEENGQLRRKAYRADA